MAFPKGRVQSVEFYEPIFFAFSGVAPPSEAMVSWLCREMGSLRLAFHFSRLIISFRENKVEPKYFFTESSLINGKI
jgi:hypothetical protein